MDPGNGRKWLADGEYPRQTLGLMKNAWNSLVKTRAGSVVQKLDHLSFRRKSQVLASSPCGAVVISFPTFQKAVFRCYLL